MPSTPRPRTPKATKSAEPKTETKRRAVPKLSVIPSPAPAVSAFNPADHYAEIADRAYFIWESRMGAPGSPHEDWLKAENDIREAYAAKSKKPRALAARAS